MLCNTISRPVKQGLTSTLGFTSFFPPNLGIIHSISMVPACAFEANLMFMQPAHLETGLKVYVILSPDIDEILVINI